MKTSRILLSALLLCALPTFAQPELQPINGLSYPLVTPEDALKMVQADKPIALHFRDVTLQAALDELSKQSGITLDTSWGGIGNKALDQKLSLDIETHSFSEAFAAILDEANVKARLRRSRGNNVLSVVFGDTEVATDLPTSGKAPFIIRAQSMNTSSSRSVTLGKTQSRNQNSSLSLNLTTDIDPLIPTFGGGRVRITKADDEQGRAIEWEDNRQQYYSDYDTGQNTQILVRFKAPPTGSQKLAHLEGVMIYVLATKYDSWNVDDVLTAKDTAHEFKMGNQTMRATINNVRQTGNQLQMDIEVNTPFMGGMMNTGRSPLFSVNQLISSMRLKDANAQDLAMSGLSSSGDGNKLTVHATFSLAPKAVNPFVIQDGKMVRRPIPEPPKLTGPISMALNAPVDFVQTEVPFSFSNLPLP